MGISYFEKSWSSALCMSFPEAKPTWKLTIRNIISDKSWGDSKRHLPFPALLLHCTFPKTLEQIHLTLSYILPNNDRQVRWKKREFPSFSHTLRSLNKLGELRFIPLTRKRIFKFFVSHGGFAICGGKLAIVFHPFRVNFTYSVHFNVLLRRF